MATPAYIPLDPNSPSGPTQSPDVYSAKDLTNVRAFRDAVVCGFVPGYSMSQAGGTLMQPAIRTWYNGIAGLQFRAQYGYDGSFVFLPVSVNWQWSNDGGATFVNMGAGATSIAWGGDATYGWAIYSVGGDGGAWVIALNALVNAQAANRSVLFHENVTTGAHGTGTLALQNANAVNISGGGIANVNISNSNLNSFGRAYPKAPVLLANGANWDWGLYNGNQDNTQFGFNHPQILNCQAGEVRRLFVIGPGAITIGDGAVDFQWAAGHPVWSATGGTLISCVCLNPTWVLGTTTPF
jgi:hypothetical protein